MDIQVKSSDVVSILGAVSLAASDDVTRPHLNSVLVRVVGKRLTVVATDGRWMLVSATVATDPEAKDGETLIPLSVVKDIVADAKKKKGAEYHFERLASGACHVSTPGRSFQYTQPDVTFPPFEQVMPSPASMSPGPGVGINPSLLAKACKAFELSEKHQKKTFFWMETSGDLDPIVLSNHSGLTALVMPARIDVPAQRVKPIEATAQAAE